MISLIRTLILASFLGLAACKKGVPDIQDLRKLTGFKLDQSVVSVTSKLTPQFTVTGTCMDHFTSIEVSFDDGGNWNPVQSVASTASIHCSDTGSFSLSFSPSVSTWIRAGTVGAAGTWKFRALSEMGNSEDVSLNLVVPQKGHLVLAGANTTSSGGYKLTSRVGGTLTATSGDYTLKGTVKAK